MVEWEWSFIKNTFKREIFILKYHWIEKTKILSIVSLWQSENTFYHFLVFKRLGWECYSNLRILLIALLQTITASWTTILSSTEFLERNLFASKMWTDVVLHVDSEYDICFLLISIHPEDGRTVAELRTGWEDVCFLLTGKKLGGGFECFWENDYSIA